MPNRHELLISDRIVQKYFANHLHIVDTGSGLQRWQVDLYWGEDEPRGPGDLMARPRGTTFEYAFSEVEVQR